MKTSMIVLTSIFLFLASCNNSRTPDNHNEMPKALDDKNSYEIISKRGPDDLVESLYAELVDKTSELKSLENRIQNIKKNKSDSTALFDKYNRKNQAYFSSVNSHIGQIKDSLLKDKMNSLIASSLAKYNSKILRHTGLLNSIDTKITTLNDLHIILKIVRTLPVIEKYQAINTPTTTSLEAFSKHLDETLKIADSLSKK